MKPIVTMSGAHRDYLESLAPEIDRLRAKLETVRGEMFDACRLVARMHHAATGLDAPKRGPVEDCADVQAELAAARRVIDEAAEVIRLSRDRFVSLGKSTNEIDFFLDSLAAPVPSQPAVSVADICNAYESGVGHAGRPTAKVNPYREGTNEHDAYAIGANGVKGGYEQPSAVPEAVAKDAARYQFLKNNPAFLYFPSSGIWRLHLKEYAPNGVAATQEEAIDAAILAAADDEAGK